MLRTISLILITIYAGPVAASFQRHLPPEDEKIRIEKKSTNAPAAQPKGSRAAKKRSNGVLFVLTRPAAATISVKSRGAVVEEGQAEDGEFRAELSPGVYDVEVTAPKHQTSSEKATVKQGAPAIIPVALTPTTGSILIGPVEPDASISVNGQKPGAVRVHKAENQIEIEDMPAGFYTLRIAHPSIADWERERIEVQGGATTYVAPRLRPAIVALVVKSEPGAAIYIDGSFKGEVAESGRTGVLDVSPGQHTIRVVKDEYATAEETRTFTAGDAEVELKLNRIVFSSEFSDFFLEGDKFWKIPSTWQVNRGNMVVRGAGLGLLKDRVYKDFKMAFDVRFVNGKGAVWVTRARDDRNYYLFQLSGPKASTPSTFRTFICEDGRMKLIKTDFVAENLSRPNDSFHIIVEAKGSTIKHSIQIKSAPRADGPQPLSLLSDNTFSYGTIGFGTLDNEEASIYFVSIVPEQK